MQPEGTPPPPQKMYDSYLYAKDLCKVRMPYLYANYKLSTSITVERGVSKHAIAFICHPASPLFFFFKALNLEGDGGKHRQIARRNTEDS